MICHLPFAGGISIDIEMEVIRGYEQELSSTCADITLLTGKLRLAASQNEVDTMSAQLEVLFSDAQETLEQIELESHALEPADREKVVTRVTSYQAELRRQQDQVASSKTEAGERSDRLELLSHPGHRGEDFQGGENSLLLAETEEILSEAGRQLHDGRRLLEETQEVGAGVLGDLHTQRETIQRSRSRLKDLEGGLGEVRSVRREVLCLTLYHNLPLIELERAWEDDVESTAEQVGLGSRGHCRTPCCLIHCVPHGNKLGKHVDC